MNDDETLVKALKTKGHPSIGMRILRQQNRSPSFWVMCLKHLAEDQREMLEGVTIHRALAFQEALLSWEDDEIQAASKTEAAK